jgi:hypothetical protein
VNLNTGLTRHQLTKNRKKRLSYPFRALPEGGNDRSQQNSTGAFPATTIKKSPADSSRAFVFG